MAKVSAFPDVATIKDEAGAWLVCLDRGELTAQETEALRDWLSRSEFHREYLHKLASNWDDMAIMSELAELFPLPNTEQRQRTGGTGRRWWPGLRIPLFAASATGAELLLFVAVSSPPFVDEPPRTPFVEDSYYTAIGEQRSFGLQDGSTISLNTNSRARVDFSGSHRIVRLQQGEVNFQVANDPERPFVVYVGSGMVWAVGTAFNVRLTSGVVDVTVTDGTVKVFADVSATESATLLQADGDPPEGGKVTIVDAGQAVQYGEVVRTVTPVSSDELTRKLAWQQGALIFQGEPLEQAIKEIARYTEQKFVIVDPSIRDRRIGGHFKSGDIETLLATLDDGFNIQSEQVAPNLIHLSAKQATLP